MLETATSNWNLKVVFIHLHLLCLTTSNLLLVLCGLVYLHTCRVKSKENREKHVLCAQYCNMFIIEQHEVVGDWLPTVYIYFYIYISPAFTCFVFILLYITGSRDPRGCFYPTLFLLFCVSVRWWMRLFTAVLSGLLLLSHSSPAGRLAKPVGWARARLFLEFSICYQPNYQWPSRDRWLSSYWLLGSVCASFEFASFFDWRFSLPCRPSFTWRVDPTML